MCLIRHKTVNVISFILVRACERWAYFTFKRVKNPLEMCTLAFRFVSITLTELFVIIYSETIISIACTTYAFMPFYVVGLNRHCAFAVGPFDFYYAIIHVKVSLL